MRAVVWDTRESEDDLCELELWSQATWLCDAGLLLARELGDSGSSFNHTASVILTYPWGY